MVKIDDNKIPFDFFDFFITKYPIGKDYLMFVGIIIKLDYGIGLEFYIFSMVVWVSVCVGNRMFCVRSVWLDEGTIMCGPYLPCQK